MAMQILDLDEHRKELKENTMLDIERDTAKTWGGRAVAAYSLANEATGEDRVNWLRDAENYRQESIEHAAMTEDIELLQNIIREIDSVRDGAIAKR